MRKIQKVNRERMRQNNARLVFETIYRQEGITRSGLAESTQMSAMTVGRIADFLLKAHFITERLEESASDVGRPAARLYVNREIKSVGVSLDADGVFIGLADPYGKLLQFDSHMLQTEGKEPKSLLESISRLIEDFTQKHGVRNENAIGMVIPGLIDHERGIVMFSSWLKWKGVPAADILADLNIPSIIIDNDIKARAMAESRLGASKKSGTSVLLNIGSGVSAGVIIDGELYRGKDNLAGEIGHAAIGTNSVMCRCGRKGCLEASISMPALLREARAVSPQIDVAGLESAYKNGEVWAKTLLGSVAAQIMNVIDVLANAYAPDVIVLCGSLMDNCGVLCGIIKKAHEEQHERMLNRSFDLEFSRLGPDGNVIGAAVMAFNHNVSRFIASSSVL